jgi:hypothetical protein
MPRWEIWNNVFSRITGFSIPVLGLEWQPPVRERDVAAKALTYIESRNVLNVSFEKEESPKRTYYDAEKIRDELTEVMQEVSRDTDVFRQLDALRVACSIFRRRLREGKLEEYSHSSPIPDEVRKAQFLQALGGYRDACGRQILALCVTYRINVPANLASCLPPSDPSE